jgi:hypothetical protein
MRSRLTTLTVTPVMAVVAFSLVTFAQTYGTKGFAPGAWKPDELPADLGKPMPFDPHDLSGVWAIPSEKDDIHWLGEVGGEGVDVPTDILKKRPPLTQLGLDVLNSHLPPPNSDKDALTLGARARFSGYDNDPVSNCDPLGFPHAWWAAIQRPFEFLQTPGRILMHIQYHEVWRSIWMDGRELPKNPDPAWNGYSVGHWDGDTLVIESTGYDERTWLDRMGDPRSSEGILEERWRRTDIDTLQIVMTITDPKIYRKPWTGGPIIFKRLKAALYEDMCVPSEEQSFNRNQRDAASGRDGANK